MTSAPRRWGAGSARARRFAWLSDSRRWPRRGSGGRHAARAAAESARAQPEQAAALPTPAAASTWPSRQLSAALSRCTTR
eukprot:scaffold60411_cov36-Phaeocystis_antarctica.AAC.1